MSNYKGKKPVNISELSWADDFCTLHCFQKKKFTKILGDILGECPRERLGKNILMDVLYNLGHNPGHEGTLNLKSNNFK